jgi:uncharacterized ion transporter superfamily protein YfcC
MPDTLLILFTLAALAWAATWLFTPGAFAVAGDPARIVPGSFTPAAGPIPAPIFGDAERTGFLDFLFAGLVTGDRNSATVGLMAFIIVLGGVFGMVMKTGATDAALQRALPEGRATSEWLVLALFVSFSLGGAVLGLGEEAIALTLLLAPALKRAGYDAVTTMLVCYVASQIGFATSWMNPFTVIIAQSIAGLPLLSGLEVRAGLWVLYTLVAALFTWRYARAVRLGLRPPLGNAEAEDDALAVPALNAAHVLVLATVIAGTGWVAWGVSAQGYYLPEIAAQFFAVGIVTALIARLGRIADTAALMDAFRDGAAQLLPAALIVGAAKGIILILGGQDPASASLLNTLLDALGTITAAMPEWLTAWTMYIVQSLFNFFVPSGSGQAGITMPIMAPLADISGVTRQTAVLAFQLGDGLTNLVIPTSAVLIACLAAARMTYSAWLAFFWRPMLGLIALSSVVMIAVHLGGY